MKQGFSALVVDDDDFSRHTVVRIVRLLGAASIVEAADGDQALQAASRNADLDLIVCDLRMPQRDGIETLRGLAAAHVRALIVLASGADVRVLRSARDMAVTFGITRLRTIEKPVTPQKLRDIFADVEAAPPVAPPLPAAPAEIAEDEIRRCFAAGEVVAYFQPKVALQTRRVVGAEALVRLLQPTGPALPPSAFLAGVQTAGLMVAMTDIIFSQAARQCAAWRQAGLDVSISVNLPIVVLNSRDLPSHLEALAAEAGLAPEHVMLEVTEDGWLRHDVVAREVLTRLRLRGFSLSVDDFGTGYASVQQLLQAPFSEIKIDQSYVRAAPEDIAHALVVSSTIALAHSLDLSVVGEGAETAAHWDVLAQAGCDIVQGYFVAAPMPGELFAAWAAAWEREAAILSAS